MRRSIAIGPYVIDLGGGGRFLLPIVVVVLLGAAGFFVYASGATAPRPTPVLTGAAEPLDTNPYTATVHVFPPEAQATVDGVAVEMVNGSASLDLAGGEHVLVVQQDGRTPLRRAIRHGGDVQLRLPLAAPFVWRVQGVHGETAVSNITLSPQGDRVRYRSGNDWYEFNLLTRVPRRLDIVSTVDQGQLSWDERTLAFLSTGSSIADRPGRLSFFDTRTNQTIVAYDPEATKTGRVLAFGWSPDSRYLIVGTAKDERGLGRLLRVDAQSGEVAVLAQLPTDVSGAPFAWSRDAKRLAFQISRPGAPPSSAITTIEGGGFQRLGDLVFSWSSDTMPLLSLPVALRADPPGVAVGPAYFLAPVKDNSLAGGGNTLVSGNYLTAWQLASGGTIPTNTLLQRDPKTGAESRRLLYSLALNSDDEFVAVRPSTINPQAKPTDVLLTLATFARDDATLKQTLTIPSVVLGTTANFQILTVSNSQNFVLVRPNADNSGLTFIVVAVE